MARETEISWTGATWNPVTGCTKISAGCKNCYAEKMAQRLRAMGHPNYRNGFELTLQPQMLELPLKWKKPQTIFLNSMSDLFHKDVPDEFIDRVFAVMALCPQHTFQILTKRADRMQNYVASLANYNGFLSDFWIGDALEDDFGKSLPQLSETRIDKPLSNVWLGVSVEHQAAADARIEPLLYTAAKTRFLSVEPLLETVDLTKINETQFSAGINCLTGRRHRLFSEDAELPKIDWVIVGGESGARARQCSLDWIYEIVNQCRAARVPCFVKQLGKFATTENVNLYDFPRSVRFEDFGLAAGSARIRMHDHQNFDEFPAQLKVREFPGV